MLYWLFLTRLVSLNTMERLGGYSKGALLAVVGVQNCEQRRKSGHSDEYDYP